MEGRFRNILFRRNQSATAIKKNFTHVRVMTIKTKKRVFAANRSVLTLAEILDLLKLPATFSSKCSGCFFVVVGSLNLNGWTLNLDGGTLSLDWGDVSPGVSLSAVARATEVRGH